MSRTAERNGRVQDRIVGFMMLAGVVLGSAGCGPDPTSVTVAEVAGNYVASVIVVQDVDFLDAGGHLRLSLAPDSTVAGELFVPEALGGPTSVDMAGTFRVRDGFVAFSQPTLTFLTGLPLRWSRGQLAVSWEAGDETGTVRLDRR